MSIGPPRRVFLRLLLLMAVVGQAAFFAAGGPLRPLTVCEVLAAPEQYDGTAVAILGRFSFRERDGRFIAASVCEQKPALGGSNWPNSLRVVFDGKDGPKPPAVLEVDAGTLNLKLERVKRYSPLGRFRFGSVDYDRWAVVYGRVEFRRDLRNAPVDALPRVAGLEPAPGQVVCRGESAVVFIPEN